MYAFQVDGLSLNEINEAAGGGHYDMGAALQLPNLVADRSATIYGSNGYVILLILKGVQIFRDLQAEFACGTDDEGLGKLIFFSDQLQCRKAEGGRLAGTRLGQADEVLGAL